jgi:hypothetical protein
MLLFDNGRFLALDRHAGAPPNVRYRGKTVLSLSELGPNPKVVHRKDASAVGENPTLGGQGQYRRS